MDDVLTITGAGKRFGGTQALDGADLTLAQGEWAEEINPAKQNVGVRRA